MTFLSLFQRENRLPLAFLEHLRPFLPWTLVATGGAGRAPVATFLPQAHGAAAAWIAKAQQRKRNVCVLMGETTGPVTGVVLVRGHLRGSRHFGVKLPASAAPILEAFRPAPFLRLEAGNTIFAGWRLFNEVPVDAIERTAKAVADALGGVTLGHLLPVAGTVLQHDSARVQLVHMFKDRLPMLTDFIQAGQASTAKLTARADAIKARAIEWLWPGVVSLGSLSLLGGAAGIGKSQCGLNIAAITSTGGQWPTGETATPPSSVLVFETEDDAASVVIPRLKAAGANMERIAVGSEAFDVSSGIDALAGEARRLGNVRLVVLSPFRRFLGDAELHGNRGVRQALSPLLAWAATNRVAVLGIAHPVKGKEHKEGFAGDAAIVEVARAAWSVIPDPEDKNPIMKHRARVMVAAKSNLSADGLMLAYRIEGAKVEGIQTSRIVWQTAASKTEHEAAPEPCVSPNAVHETQPPLRIVSRTQDAANVVRVPARATDAVTWLRAALAHGARDAADLKRDAVRRGISTGALYRAVKRLGVVIEGGGFGEAKTWRL